MHIVCVGPGTRRIRIKQPVKIFRSVQRRVLLFVICSRVKRRSAARAQLIYQRAHTRNAGLIIRFFEINGARNLSMHRSSAELLRSNLLPNRRLHQRRPGEKQPAAFRHQHGIGHHRQIRAACHAHAHDGRDLRNILRRHHRVIAKDAPKIILIRKHILLQRKKHAGRVNQINRGNTILKRNRLRADHLLRRHGKERAGLHRGIVRNDHHEPAMHAAQAGDNARRRRSTPLRIHFVCGIKAKLKKLRAGIKQQRKPFAHRQPLLGMLRVNRLRAAAKPNRLLLAAHGAEQHKQGLAVFHVTRDFGIQL